MLRPVTRALKNTAGFDVAGDRGRVMGPPAFPPSTDAMTAPDPLHEYMRIVRALNACKLRLLSVKAKLRNCDGPTRRQALLQRQHDITAEMAALHEEGERWIRELHKTGRQSTDCRS
jgi:hypothetical protein